MKYQSLNSTSSNPCLTLDLIQQRFKELSKKQKIILKTVVILLFLAIIIMAVKKPSNKPTSSTSQNKPITTTTTSATTTTGNEICLNMAITIKLFNKHLFVNSYSRFGIRKFNITRNNIHNRIYSINYHDNN